MAPQSLGPRPPQVLALGPGTCSSDAHVHLQRPSRWVLGEEPACISSWREGVRPPPQVLSSSGSGAPCHLCRVGEGPILTSRSVCPCRLQAARRQPCCSQPWEMGPSLRRKDTELKAGPENPRSRRNVPGLVLPTCPLAHAGSHRHLCAYRCTPPLQSWERRAFHQRAPSLPPSLQLAGTASPVMECMPHAAAAFWNVPCFTMSSGSPLRFSHTPGTRSLGSQGSGLHAIS